MVAAAIAVALAAAAFGGQATPLPAQAAGLRARMLAAEDARVSDARDMAPLFEGLRAPESALVAQAVRALGRFERPHLVRHILPLAAHGRSEVRIEAVNALGQALAAVPRDGPALPALPPELDTVATALAARIETDSDPRVAGMAAETLGRLPFRTGRQVQKAEQVIAALLPTPGGRVPRPGSLTGAVKGAEALVRLHRKRHSVSPDTQARLKAAAAFAADSAVDDPVVIRRVAWLALTPAGGVDASLLERGIRDPDPQVRRHAVVALGDVDIGAARLTALLERVLADSSSLVRYDAVRVYARSRSGVDCAPLLTAVDDPSAHVALAAVDALAGGCPGAAQRLIALVDGLPDGGFTWHRAARALVSLARARPDAAAARLERLAGHRTWQVRMYAARAAAAIPVVAWLDALAGDSHDNVREAAIAGLLAVRGHAADGAFIEALGRPDYQLVLTAARALEGSTAADRAVPALAAAFARITAERRETSRDPRMAILARLRELGDARHATALQPCAADFDQVVAERCRATLLAWTGSAPPPQRPRPSLVAVPSIGPERARVTMARGRSFELRLFPEEAPATVARFARLSREGYYNGLTFHRVVPNFVLQGGSPGANEYMGDGPYMRDELGLRSHRRGTVGVSTRGRDTGDAQVFINLLDNPRLDHNYTVFAEVVSGLDVVDSILEGDVIARIDVLEPASTQRGR